MSTLSVPVSTEDRAQGDPHAPVTLVEYGDYQCPSCGDAFEIVKQLQEQFGKKLRFVYRDFPLEMHPYAQHAAETASMAAEHGKFWEMHDLLFGHQRDLQDRVLLKLARELKLAPEELTHALEEGTYADRIEADMNSGIESGVHGTPTFFINGRQHQGSYDLESMVEAIEAAAK